MLNRNIIFVTIYIASSLLRFITKKAQFNSSVSKSNI